MKKIILNDTLFKFVVLLIINIVINFITNGELGFVIQIVISVVICFFMDIVKHYVIKYLNNRRQ